MSHWPGHLKPRCPRCFKDTLEEKFHRGELVYCCPECRWCWPVDAEVFLEGERATATSRRPSMGKDKRSRR
jgi:hypothetical protein